MKVLIPVGHVACVKSLAVVLPAWLAFGNH